MTKKAAKKKVSRKVSRKKSPGAGKAEAPEAEKAPARAPAEDPVTEKEPRQEAPDESPKATGGPGRSNRVMRPEPARTKSREGEGRDGRSRSGSRRGRREGGRRPRIDEAELGKKAWKVFQQEIAEEGLALIDEGSARALAEKSILVTRAFLEERERRLGRQSPGDKVGPEGEALKEEDREPADED